MDTFTKSYIACALWSSTDNADESGGEPMDKNYSEKDIASETLAKMKEDCAQFQLENETRLENMDSRAAGTDFWLTRNRHGVGFWDRGLGALGQILTKKAHDFGSFDLYIGDDGKIYGN